MQLIGFMVQAWCDLDIYFTPRPTNVAPPGMVHVIGVTARDWSNMRGRGCFIWTGILSKKLDYFQGQTYFLLKHSLEKQF